MDKDFIMDVGQKILDLVNIEIENRKTTALEIATMMSATCALMAAELHDTYGEMKSREFIRCIKDGLDKYQAFCKKTVH